MPTCSTIGIVEVAVTPEGGEVGAAHIVAVGEESCTSRKSLSSKSYLTKCEGQHWRPDTTLVALVPFSPWLRCRQRLSDGKPSLPDSDAAEAAEVGR